MSNPVEKGTKIVTGAAAIAALVKAEYDDEHGEYTRVTLAGIPVFKRDARGNPKVFGIPFGRWIRGARR